MKDSRRSFLLEPPERPLSPGVAFLRHAIFRLRDDYLKKIERALATLDDDAVWARLNGDSNSIGNLILHGCGNLRQWIISGVGKKPDERERSLEFAARNTASIAELLQLLSLTIEEAVAVLSRLQATVEGEGEAELQCLVRPQGYDQSVLDAIFHAVEHFSYHTGQIMMLAKWKRGAEIKLYDDGLLENR